MTDLRATFTPAGTARRKSWLELCSTDPLLGAPRVAQLLGPDDLPAEAFDETNVARILALS
jgi:hypothetical protein